MGLNKLKQLINYSDFELSQNKEDAIKYRQLDTEVLDTRVKCSVHEVITPKLNQPIIKTMTGALYPLFSGNKLLYIMGVVTPADKLIKLDFETVFKLSIEQLDTFLVKPKYKIYYQSLAFNFSRMEIRILFLLLKSKNANEMACCLALKQTTVESYISNIKNKIGISRKSEMIDFVIAANLFSQILI